ncbi:uncharacterized protein LOC132612262 [Lycium barbarum]|uniref:uncharacterized protein LOC132612262 n=1 Tax=Lycium barbarum TaxID=112863 RepID=UPI00293EDFC6|nr:uncharacterized protein LOC132612262 [Lycium barbarum]
MEEHSGAEEEERRGAAVSGEWGSGGVRWKGEERKRGRVEIMRRWGAVVMIKRGKRKRGDVGTPLSMDMATENRTRPSMAKVRVEVDLNKPKIDSVWIGIEDEDCPLKGFTQKFEYENVPKFCRHCKLIGHTILQCRHAEKKKAEAKDNQKTEEVKEAGEKENDSHSEIQQSKDSSKDEAQVKNDGRKEVENKNQKKEITENEQQAKEREEALTINERIKTKKKKNKVHFKNISGRSHKKEQGNNKEENGKEDITTDNEEEDTERKSNKRKKNIKEDTHEGKGNGKQMSQESKVKDNKDEIDSSDQRSQERNGTDNKEEEEEISTSLSSRFKDCEGINLVVDLNCENDKQEDDFEGNSDDEVVESLIQFFAPNTIHNKEEKEITLKFNHNIRDQFVYITAVYAKCTSTERKDLWDSLATVSANIDAPWCIGGDFNVIMDSNEKMGGLPHRAYKSIDFISCMDQCGVTDIGFVGSKYTWCNNWEPRYKIRKRLDRILVNDQWEQKFQKNMVKHLARTGSDHRPLLLKCQDTSNNFISYFRFLNFWTEQEDFLEVVQNVWDENIPGNAMWRLHQKLKLLSKRLIDWSRITIGNVHDQTKEWEEKLQALEDLELIDNSDQVRKDLNRTHAEYIRWQFMQDSLLKQKSQMKWFEEGDGNTRYFHSVVREKRRRLHIHRIKNSKGKWMHSEGKIGNSAVRHFERLFCNQKRNVDNELLNVIPRIITENDNEMLNILPEEEEIQKAIFSMSPTSSAGPDGYTGRFYQKCWQIIKREVIEFVQEFFKGSPISRYFTHTCLALIPKVNPPTTFSEVRPISLSNFSECQLF